MNGFPLSLSVASYNSYRYANWKYSSGNIGVTYFDVASFPTGQSKSPMLPAGKMEASRPCKYRPSHENRDCQKLALNQLDELKTLQSNWDSYGAETPNTNALSNAREIILRVIEKQIMPNRILPSVEGGVSIVFGNKRRLADIEIFNDGDVIVSLMNDQAVKGVFQIEFEEKEIDQALERIATFING